VAFSGVDQGQPFGILRAANDHSRHACYTLANAPAALVVSVLAANGDAKGISAAPGQRAAWNDGTGKGGDDIQAAGGVIKASPMATVCQALDHAKPWSLLAVPLNAAITTP